jgi:error-prone DNA polymerase
MLICRQRPPTAKGFCFLSLEDETGIANLVVPPDAYERHRKDINGALFLMGQGTLEKVGKVANVKVQRLEALSGAGLLD